MSEAMPADIIVGVDTRKRTHAAVAITGLGARVAALTIQVGPAGYRELEAWARSLGVVRAFGIEVIRLALLVAQPAVGTADLVDDVAPLAEEARQAGAVRARALDAEGADGSRRPRPSLELAVAGGADLDRQFPEAGAEPRDGHGGVGVLVGVDADDDVGG